MIGFKLCILDWKITEVGPCSSQCILSSDAWNRFVPFLKTFPLIAELRWSSRFTWYKVTLLPSVINNLCLLGGGTLSYVNALIFIKISIYSSTYVLWTCGFLSGTSGEEPTCQCKRHKRQFWSLGWENSLEQEMATNSIILAWRIPWTESLVGYSPQGRKESSTTEAT